MTADGAPSPDRLDRNWQELLQESGLWLVEQADIAARAGLALLAIANIGALWLILDLISWRWLASVAAALLSAAVIWLWDPAAAGSAASMTIVGTR